MNEAAVNRIVELAEQRRPIERAPDFELTGRYFVRKADGSLDSRTAARPRPSARLFDTLSLGSLIRQEIEDTHNENAVEVYYSADRIVALIFDAGEELYRRHAIELERHPVFTRLQRLVRTEQFTQKQLIKLLRAEFNGHIADTVIEKFRSLKLSTDGENASVVRHGHEAVDRKIQQKIRDERGESIPDEITIAVPVYDLDEIRESEFDVTVLVDVTSDGSQPMFELTAVVNDLRAAERAALDMVVDNLSSNMPGDTELFYGSV